MTAGVEIRALTKHYGTTLAVDDVDLVVEPGEFLTLLGPSGCGKTTTLRSIAGLEQPDSGHILIGDREVFGPDEDVPVHRRQLGMVFQGYAVWPHMTVFENVRYPLRMQRRPRREHAAVVEETLARVGLADYAKRYPSELSGGQQQRVALGRAIASNPAVILYDEPLSNLDAALREQMRFELRSLHHRLGTTAIYVTHDQQEALTLSDRICLMDGGRIVQVGTPRELYDHPANAFASEFLGTANLWAVDQDRAPHGTTLRLSSGHDLDVGEPDGTTAPPDVARVTIRPHQVELLDDREDWASTPDNVFDAVVRDASFLGDRMRYVLSVEGSGTLTVVAEENTATHAARGVDSAVRVLLPRRHCLPVR